jgi:hypothetical protein
MSDIPAPDRSPYEKWKEADGKTYFGPWYMLGLTAFYGYLIANRAQAAPAVGLAADAVWLQLLLLAALFFTGSFAMSVSSVLCYHYTGIVYTKDRKGFALAGGFDVGRVPMLLAQAGVFFLYWFTASMTPDPLASVRNPWIVLGLAFGVGLIFTVITGVIVYSQQSSQKEGEW